MDVRIGTSGWQYASWRDRLYPPALPQARWLARYAGAFDVVEVNSTFYGLPRVERVARWLEQVPQGFAFAIKGSRYVTQTKRLRDFGVHAPLLVERVQPLIDSGALPVILWQLPEGWPRDDDRLAAALAELPGDGVRHAFEFRHASWFADTPLDLLRAHGVALAIGDDPRRPYQRWETTTDLAYVRMHRSGQDPSGRYTESELRRLARWLAGAKQTGATAWVFLTTTGRAARSRTRHGCASSSASACGSPSAVPLPRRSPNG